MRWLLGYFCGLLVGVLSTFGIQRHFAKPDFVPAIVHGKNIGMVFEHAIVPLDGQAYADCTFDNCIFTWSGLAPIMIMRSHFSGDMGLSSPKIPELLEPAMSDWSDPDDPERSSPNPTPPPEAAPPAPNGESPDEPEPDDRWMDPYEHQQHSVRATVEY